MISVYPDRKTSRRNAIKSIKVTDSNINQKFCKSCYKTKNLIACNNCCRFYCDECLLKKYSS